MDILEPIFPDTTLPIPGHDPYRGLKEVPLAVLFCI